MHVVVNEYGNVILARTAERRNIEFKRRISAEMTADIASVYIHGGGIIDRAEMQYKPLGKILFPQRNDTGICAIGDEIGVPDPR